jgi:hypothetical protein
MNQRIETLLAIIDQASKLLDVEPPVKPLAASEEDGAAAGPIASVTSGGVLLAV